VAFLISWAVIGHDADGGRQRISSDAPAAEGQMPGTGSSGNGSGSADPGRRQGASGADTPSGSGSGQGQGGGVPSARSGAS